MKNSILALVLVLGFSGCSLNSTKEENRNTMAMNKCCGCGNMEKCEMRINPATKEKELCCSPSSCACPDTKNISGNYHDKKDSCGNCH